MLTGAGIFIVQNYKNKNVVVLFGKNHKDYNEPGGIIDPGETPEEAACRETREETANLIKIKPHQLKKIGTPIRHHNYLSYIIYIKNLSLKDYYHNINLLQRKCNRRKHHHWMETDTAKRIDLDVFIKYVLADKNIIPDINGKMIPVRNRTIGIIKKGLNDFEKLKNPVKLNDKVTVMSKMKCLIGTYTYILN